ncbi:MAG: aldehyde dehydrogenase family protein [Phycisphaerae bacterium]|nr:aldehyde dehydrogenase family protein [Phycisphaerae bacterium]
MAAMRPIQPVDSAALAARAAFARSLPRGAVHAALDTLAEALESAREPLLALAAGESALSLDELAPEFARMTGTLRLFAAASRQGAWSRPTIDTPAPLSIGPGHDCRSMLVPLGPVAVFGASNFPLAYGVCGGDTASALAAGCPVIVKEHPAHPRTGRALAALARSALDACGLEGFFHYLLHEDPLDHSIARALVAHPAVAAAGFTGSRTGGLALESVARARPTPIPVFAEMGSANPVIVTPAAAAHRADDTARSLADAILLRHGQQCTCPGIILLAGAHEQGRALIVALSRRLGSAPARRMLAPWIADAFLRRIAECRQAGVTVLAGGAAAPEGHAATVLLSTDLETFRASPTLHDECFGPSALIVDLPEFDSLAEAPLPPSLTCTVITAGPDDPDAPRALARAVESAGRVIIDGVPTGVRVCDSMVHGGPYPATNAPHTTAVGPRAIERWCRPITWQHCPDHLLPPALQNANPLALTRTVNGRLTSNPVGAPATGF